ncbi:hypothetical protein [Veronia pacifica]|uniref:Uncharacterized protein n=1 Tax=Veronia pacifica TaxID=1080227 RepID=A0A1C3ESP5_9GAMM|nr:hypothetical protein [Veronia pacifica]ODA36268.1 hypothetical protein A8L45_01320 [Veronia pacifica]
MNKIRAIFLLAVAIVFTGCTSIPDAPINHEKTSYNTSEKSIAFGRITVKNNNAPSFQPELWNLSVMSEGKKFEFSIRTNMIADHGENGREYFFSFEAPAGMTQVQKFTLHAGVPLLVSADGAFELDQMVKLEKGKITYLGDITATIVEKKDNEEAVGPLLPLIDQRVAGFSNGTFSVDVKDHFEEDLELLKLTYPAIKGQVFTKNIVKKPALYQ